jgi:hypothetical protein
MLHSFVSAALFSALVASTPTALPVPPRALRAVEDRLSDTKAGVAAVVSVARVGVARGCTVVGVDVADGSFVGSTVAKARAAKSPLSFPGTGTGKDARGRPCSVAVTVDVSWRALQTIPTGSPITILMRSGVLEVEGAGVVVPCASADRDAGFVCARSSAGSNVVKGVVEDGSLVVQP